MKVLTAFLLVLSGLSVCVAGDHYPNSVLQEVPFHEVKVDDPFWSERIRVIQEVTLPDLLDLAEEQGKIDNFRMVAGRKAGKYRTYNAPDSDVYKLIEDAAYALAWRTNAGLERRIDGIIEDIIAAQQPDGYLNTQFTISLTNSAAPDAGSKFVNTFGFGPEYRWASRADNWPKAYSQLYCAGHLMEAAAAYYRATGKRALLQAATKNADHIRSVFTPERIKDYADHPEVEIGLMRLYDITGDESYARLAEEFSRYVQFSRPPDLGRAENSKPLAEQRCAYGHCVRTAYIYAGATDAVRFSGASDLRSALEALWSNVVSAKVYLHGGTGNGSPAEQHGHDFDLPIGATYSETCAAIAQAQWNHALNLLSGESRHAALVEHELWNNALAGISLDGTNYFYANKLNLGTDGRRNEHSGVRKRYLFCCPSKVPGLVSGVGRWIYAKDGAGLTVNQFIGSSVVTKIAGGTLSLNQESKLPWAGEVNFTIETAPTNELSLRLRVPAWTSGSGPIPAGLYHFGGVPAPKWSLRVNGKAALAAADANGYLVLKRTWLPGDTVAFCADLPVRRVYTDQRVAANRGRVALMRGPLLYCLEGVDNDFDVLNMVLPRETEVSAEWRSNLLGGGTILRGAGSCRGEKVRFTAVPYFTWENRGVAPVATLLIETPEMIAPDSIPLDKPMNTDG